MLPHWASDLALYTQVLSLQVSETINSILYSGISKFKIPSENYLVMPFSPVNIITSSVTVGEKGRDRNNKI